jgi:hypothetical protein
MPARRCTHPGTILDGDELSFIVALQVSIVRMHRDHLSTLGLSGIEERHARTFVPWQNQESHQVCARLRPGKLHPRFKLLPTQGEGRRRDFLEADRAA